MDIPENNEQAPIAANSRSLLIAVFFALLSFFIMLYAVSASDTKKSGALVTAMQKEFHDKDIKDEFMLYQRPDDKPTEKTFKDVITQFTDTQTVGNISLTETPSLYILKMNSLGLFSIDSNEPKGKARDFLLSLDNYIGLNKKRPEGKAKMVMFFGENKGNVSDRILALEAILGKAHNRNIDFSVTKARDSGLYNQIYILFDKNEF